MDYSLLTKQKISEKYKDLSQDLKDVLSSANTSAVIENIAVKYQLDKEKIEMLVQLVGLIILGLATFEDMKTEMKEVLEINPQFIPPIADEIHQKIFLPIANSLQKTITAPPAPAPTAPVAPAPVAPPVDKYREPPIGPEVIDLRNQPRAGPPLAETPPPPPPPPVVSRVEPPLIEAEPHKAPAPAPVPVPVPVPESLSKMPQVILRPPGLPPTDLPRDILDLRKDKGEF